MTTTRTTDAPLTDAQAAALVRGLADIIAAVEEYEAQVAAGEDEDVAAETVDAGHMPFAEWRRHYGRESDG